MSRNIKEIGKELLGKSLNSFHRKTGLTQLEKNNEMQDGILDGILSQVDDAYIEKTEQSNVIHLDGSGDGVVILDGIEGNTMVNLCGRMNSGDTQWILNNGWWELNKEGVLFLDFEVTVKPSTLYTVIMNTKLDNSGGIVFGFRKDNLGWNSDTHSTELNGVNKFKFTTSSEETNRFTLHRGITVGETTTIGVKDIMILEGDWTNKEIPASYFEGLQSSFEEQVEDDKYKIEILSSNKNLFKVVATSKKVHSSGITVFWNKEEQSFTLNGTTSNDFYMYGEDNVNSVNPYWIDCKKTDEKISVSVQYEGGYNINNNDDEILYLGFANGTYGRLYGSSGKFIMAQNGILTSDVEKPWMRVKGGTTFNNFKVRIQFEKSNNVTSYAPYTSNKIKLLLDEPLYKGNKVCIKNGCLGYWKHMNKIVLDGSENWNTAWSGFDNDIIKTFHLEIEDKAQSGNSFCDKFRLATIVGSPTTEFYTTMDGGRKEFAIGIMRTKLTTQNVEGFKTWLSNNPVTVIYELAEPLFIPLTNEYGEPIILEGYENGTIYIDSTIVPTTTVRYTPKMESFKTLKEVENNNIMLTNDVNDNIIPYMMDVDLMIMEKEMALMSHKNIRTIGVKDMTSMQKRTQDMLTRLIKGKTLTEQECKTRVTTYLNAGKITDAQAEELNFLIDEIYA